MYQLNNKDLWEYLDQILFKEIGGNIYIKCIN